MPGKMPFRPGNEISQTFNNGIARIYRMVDQAEPGYKPDLKPVPVATLRYEEQRLGVTRFYAAQQNNVQVEKVIRVPAGAPVAAQDVVVTEDGFQFDVNLVQTVPGVWPASLDLTLVATKQDRVSVSDPDTSLEVGKA